MAFKYSNCLVTFSAYCAFVREIRHANILHVSAFDKCYTSSFPSQFLARHICHLYHLYIGGEKSVMCRNFRFQYMTDVEKSEISPRVEEFQIFKTTDVEKSEILPNLEELRNSASSFHWLSSSIFNVCSSFVRPASVTPPLISTI